MLNILRKRSQSIVIQGMVLLIAIVFIFWGVGTNLNDNRSAVATVNGEEISVQEFQQRYDQTVESYRQQFGGQLPQGLLDGLNIKQQVLTQLIQAELMRQGAKEMGLMVSKETTRQRIQEMDVFKAGGQFDMARYKEVLSQNRMTPKSFEGGIQDELLTGRVVDLVGSFALLSENELQAWIDYNDQEIKLAYRVFKGNDFEDKVEVVDADLAAWYETAKEKYTADSKIKLSYMFFAHNENLDEITVDDAAVEAWYKENQQQYFSPEQRQARHILFKLEEGAGDDTRQEKMNKALEVLELARGGQDFSELAQTYSEGPTRDKGGDLGFFSRGQMVKEFDEAVFTMEAGQISEPVETSFGFHLIKLEAIRPEATRSLEDVKAGIVATLKKQQAKGITFKQASAAYEALIKAGNLAKYREQEGAKVLETEYFSRETAPEGVLNTPAMLNAAFALRKGELSSLVESDEGYGILFIEDIEAPVVPELEAVRESAIADYRKAKSVELARSTAEKILAESKEAGGLQEEGAVSETGFLRRSSQGGDLPAQVVQDAFAQLGKTSLPDEVIVVDNTFYLYEIRQERLNAQPMEDQKRKDLKQQLVGAQKNKLVADWLEQLQASAKIWTNAEILQ